MLTTSTCTLNYLESRKSTFIDIEPNINNGKLIRLTRNVRKLYTNTFRLVYGFNYLSQQIRKKIFFQLKMNRTAQN